MKVFPLFILFLVVFSQLSQSTIFVHFDQHIPLQLLKKDPHIEITITSSLNESPQDANSTKNLQFFLLKSTSKYKHKAYSKIRKNYEKLVNTLIQKLIIGDQRLLVKSKIKQKYLKKKGLWQFGIMFMMQGQKGELSECYHDVAKLGVTKMTTKPFTFGFSQAIIASNSFYKLKKKVLNQLSKIPQMAILKVKNMEINGLNLSKAISLQKKQTYQSFELKEEMNDQTSFIPDFLFSKDQITRDSKSFTMRAIFEVGPDAQTNIFIEEDQSESSEFESQSNGENESNEQNLQRLEQA